MTSHSDSPSSSAEGRSAPGWWRRGLRLLSILFGTVCLLLCALLFWALVMLRAAPEEWSFPLRLGPWTLQASVPTAYRLITHPVALKGASRLMDGRAVQTRWGPVSLTSAGDAGPWQLDCEPCLLTLRSLGSKPLPLARLSATFQRNGQDHLRGDFVVYPAAADVEAAQPSAGMDAVKGRWQLQMERQQAELRVDLPPTPVRSLVSLWSAQLPEWPRVQIDGRIRLDARWQFPRSGADPSAGGRAGDKINLQLEGFAVSGLGTEALRLAQAGGCAGAVPDGGWGPWLPRAVMAAEDQRFMEHTGFDLAELQAAWASNQAADKGLRGGSTLSQQLAKMIYTGDDRHPLRKLRELLYAVELDRVLGKARVLDLYLAMAPWGQGQCGAVAAAKHYFKKPVQRLSPVESAWLAGLLRAPEHELTRWAEGGAGRIERTAWVIKQMRPLPAKQRQALVAALPDWDGPLALAAKKP